MESRHLGGGRGAVYCDRSFGRNKLRPSRMEDRYLGGLRLLQYDGVGETEAVVLHWGQTLARHPRYCINVLYQKGLTLLMPITYCPMPSISTTPF